MIYHVTTAANWLEAQKNGLYSHPSLEKENFIHACSRNQLAGVLSRYYQGITDLVLLHIDENLLTAPFQYDLAPSINEQFPHIYGPINTEAVVTVEKLC